MGGQEISTYILSFLTDEEKQQSIADMTVCIENAWLHPTDDFDLTITFIAHQIEHLCENLFDPPKVGVNPIKNYFDANPGEGSYDLTVLDSNGNDVTSMYSKL
jgi:hypothetical protein